MLPLKYTGYSGKNISAKETITQFNLKSGPQLQPAKNCRPNKPEEIKGPCSQHVTRPNINYYYLWCVLMYCHVLIYFEQLSYSCVWFV